MANVVDIIVNASDRASSVVKAIGNSFSDLEGRASKASGALTGILGTAGVALGAVMVAGAQMNSELESSFSKWKTLTGSVEGANKQLDFIQQYAKDSPFDFVGVDQTATSLNAMGVELGTVNKWIPTLGDMASVLGGGTEQIQGVGTALGQMNAKGKVSAEEMGQLAERGVNAWGFLADGMNMTVGEVRQLSEDGKILAKDALPIIMDGMKKTFGGGTAEYMKSTKGQFDNLTESAKQFAGQITKPAYEWLGAVVLPALNSALSDLQGMFEGGLMSGFQQLFSSKWAVPMVVLAGVITGALIGALAMLAPMVISAVSAFAPFLLIGVLIAGVVAMIIANWDKLKPYFTAFWEAIKPVVMGFVDSIKSSFSTFMSYVQPLWEAFKKVIQSLMPIIIAVVTVLGAQLAIGIAIINGVIRAIAPLVTAFLNLLDVVINVVMAVVSVLTGDWDSATKYWNKATQSAIDFFKNLWTAVVEFFKGIWSTITSVLGKFGIDVNKKISDMWNKAVNWTKNGITKIVDWFKGLPAKAGAFVTKLKSDIQNKFQQAMSSAQTAVMTGISKVIGFFRSLPTKASSALSSLSSSIKSRFDSAINSAKQAVSGGITRIVSTIKGWVSTFMSSGKGLIDAFAKGISNGIGKAVDAVSSGMKKIRSFLPFSPAKKGALSDLDKSGESFFPTWYNGALKKVPAMSRAIGGAMAVASREIEGGLGVPLQSFTAGRSKLTVTHIHEHSGEIAVQGDTSKETLSLAGQSIHKTTESDVLKDLRQAIRKR